MEALSRWAAAIAEFVTTEIFGFVLGLPKQISEWYQEAIEGPHDAAFREDIAALERNGLPSEIGEELREISDKLPRPVDSILGMVLLGSLGTSKFWDWISGQRNLVRQQVNADLRPNLVELSSLIRYAQLYPDDYPKVKAILDKWGLPDQQQQIEFFAREQLLSLQELIPLTNRGIIEQTEAEETLTRQGMQSDTASLAMRLAEFYPGPADIVTLAGREAFEEDAISAFQLDKDMPDEYIDAAAKAGVSREIARWYWVAHWNNPSLNQVFSMIHRRAKKPDGSEFSTADLDIYYRLADISPFFGDLLRQIAFTPKTRVDIRRMFNMDVITRSEVHSAYLDIGYTDANAELMTQFAEKLKEESGRDLTRSQLEKLYQIGELDGLEFVDALQVLDYTLVQAWDIKALIDAKIEEKRIDSFIDRAEAEFKRGVKSQIEVSSDLSNQGIGSGRVSEYLREWVNQLVVERRIPSKQDLVGFLGSGLIDVATFRVQMGQHLYGEESITLYIQSTGTLPSKTDLIKQLDQEVITEERAREGFKALGYADRDIEAFIAVDKLTKERRARFEQIQGSGDGAA